MKFKLDSPKTNNSPSVSYGKSIVLLGSCFSDEIAVKLQLGGFSQISNPFGTIFHPIPLAFCIDQALSEQRCFDFLEQDATHYCWDASHLLAANSHEGINYLIETKAQELRLTLQSASHLFITLGTAWAYEHKTLRKTVANCHKQAADLFDKKMSPLSEMCRVWRETLNKLKAFNPEIQICFTVSPVRHVKDGLVENNRSKARLFELFAELENEFDLLYFPAFEILIDELRDYRFYSADLIHPSPMAVDYIWEKWLDSFCSAEIKNKLEEVLRLRSLAAHIIQHPDSEKGQQFQEEREAKIQDFLALNPSVVW